MHSSLLPAPTGSPASGNLWLYGGSVLADTNGTSYNGQVGDLWECSPGSGQWTWVAGSSTPNLSGTYGTQGVAAAGDWPGARFNSTGWIDASGNLWLFGGEYWIVTDGGTYYLNDLWKYPTA